MQFEADLQNELIELIAITLQNYKDQSQPGRNYNSIIFNVDIK